MGKLMEKIFKYGERGSGLRSKGEIQDFQKIRDKCLQAGCLFEDPEFPAADSSIYYSKKCEGDIKWLRPSEICSDPHLFIEGASRFDIVQGALGDCWLLAAVANLTLHDALFYRVVPKDQSFVKDYAGVFHFRFWQYGRWVDIVVDDRLPTRQGRLVYMHSKTLNEFWSALLEKAYAKLHGSYEALTGGLTSEATEDFTGGVTEIYELEKAPSNFYRILQKAFERWSLIGCSTLPDPNVKEQKLPNGLIRGHAYSITKVKKVEVQTPQGKVKFQLLRVRNPWGNEWEWNGAWSDRSAEWNSIPPEEKEALGLKFDVDGEFWISYKDFKENFFRVEICNLSPDSLDDELLSKSSKKKWAMSIVEGSWIKNCTAGGCWNYLDTFWVNPQYFIVLGDADEVDDEDDDEDEDLCTVIVALMQKNRRRNKKLGQGSLSVGFGIYMLDNPDHLPKPLPKPFFQKHTPVAQCKQYEYLREVNCHFKLPPGTYCIVPSTFKPGEEGDFVLRVFTEKVNNMSKHDQDIGITKPDDKVVQKTEEEKRKDQEAENFFTYSAGEDLEVDCSELQKILNFVLKKEFTFEGFSLDVCKSMVAMMDVDRSGKLGLEEFKNLWADIRNWKNVFKQYDADHSGSLDTLELRTALNSAGYRLNVPVLRALVHRYGKNGKITFDDFIMCAVKLKTMIETFQEKDPRKTSMATFTLEEWVEKTMYI